MMKKLMLILIILSIWGIGNVAASNIQWYDYNTGIDLAETQDKPIIIYFYADNDHIMDKVLSEKEVIEQAGKFINIKVNVNENNDAITLYGVRSTPYFVFLNKEKQEINRVAGGVDKTYFLIALNDSWNKKDEAGKPNQIEEFNLGTKSIQELKNFLDEKKTKTVKVQFSLIGTIRNLEGNGDPYLFYLDDGTGTVRAKYFGGLGDITNGDRIKVEGFYAGVVRSAESIGIGANNVLKVDGSEPHVPPNSQNSESPKTPGFEVIIGVAAVFFARRKIISK